MEPTYRDNPGSYRTYLTRSGGYVADPNWAIGGKFDRPSQRDNSPTVFSDSNIRENVIPGLNARANDLLGERPKFYRTQSGGYVNTKFADPSLQGSQTYTEDQIMGNTSGAVSGADATDNSGQQNGGENEYDTLFKNIMGSNAYKTGAAAIEQSPESIQEKALIDQMRTMADANSAAQLSIITKQYQQRQDLLKQVQSEEGQGLKHQLMMAGSRYAPGSTGAVMTTNEKQHLQELSSLQDQGEAAKQAVKNAQLNQDFQLMEKEIGRLENIRTAKSALATKLQDKMTENNKELRDQTQKTKEKAATDLTAAKKDAYDTATKNGAPPAVLTAISGAKTPGDAYQAIVGYGGNANHDIIDINGSKALVDKNTGSIIKWIGGGSGGGGDIGTAIPSSSSSYQNFLVGRTPEQASYFKSMNDVEKSNVQSLIDGDTDLQTLFPSRGNQGGKDRQKYLDLAKKVDPSYSPAVGTSRVAFIKNWNDPNKASYNFRLSANTALGHLADLKANVDKLATNSSFKKANQLSQWFAENVNTPGVADVVANMKSDISQLGGELANVFSRGVADVESIKDQRAELSTVQPKNIINSVINEKIKLVADKILEAGNEYKNSMGSYPKNSLINLDSLQNMADNGIDINPIVNALKAQGIDTSGVSFKPKTAKDFLNSPIPSDSSVSTYSPAFWSKLK